MQAGRVLAGRYELEHELGSGGAAVVWRAHDRTLDRTVAIKLLHPGLDRDERTLERFRREAQAAASLNHRHAIAIYDIGEDEGDSYIVMEHVAGPSLADLTGTPLDPGQVAALGFQVSSALGAAHAEGLIHRDVKPANILLGRDGQAKVADFGIAKAMDAPHSTLTESGTVVGTMAYLAPEQIRGDDIDARTDVYALGLVLHEALSGDVPFGEGTPAEVTARRLATDPEPLTELRPDLPEDLSLLVDKATRLDPSERFENGRELAAALQPLLTDEPRPLVRALARTEPRSRSDDRTTQELSPANAASAVTVEIAPDGADGVPSEAAKYAPQRKGDTPPEGSPVPDVLPERADDREDRDPVMPVKKPVLVVVGVVAAVLVAVNLLGGGGGGGGDGGSGGEGDDRGQPETVAVTAAQDFDPEGEGGEEHREDVPKAHDGDPATSWVTEQYDSADMGGLKAGVGIWFDLGATHDIASVEVTLASPGIDFEVYVGDAAPEGTDPSGWGAAVETVEDASESVTIEVPDDVRGRYVLLWVTSVGGAGARAEIAEVRFLAR